MKKIKRIMVLLVMLALSISAFVLPAQRGRVYADTRVTNLTDTTWVIKNDKLVGHFNFVSYSINWEDENYSWTELHIYGDEFLDGLLYNEMGCDVLVDAYEDWVGGESEGELPAYGPYGGRTMHFISGTDIANSDLIDWLYLNADLQVDEPAQTGVITDIVIPVVLALVVGTIIAFVVMDNKKVFVK